MIELAQNTLIGAAVLGIAGLFLTLLAFLVQRAPWVLLLGLAIFVGYVARIVL